MDPNASSREETIFSAALEYAPDERRAYLDRACAGDLALRRRIEELLGAQREIGGFMEPHVMRGDAGVPTSGKDGAREVPPERIGRYKLLQKIGEGGCGVVYMAEQEEPVKRRVALKLIKLGMDTRSVIARFEAERQALAMMEHPNIAKVYDAGATESGRPYFVMELVRGVRITDFCDQHQLTTHERLRLFIQVCQAVQHAHQKGVIHRDLKPSNILVTIQDPGAPGVSKIIDFGIAKATQGRLTDQTLFTAFEQFLGTPAYMSPEQTLMTAQDVDTRSDIYSLGVLLYELITGRTPFDAKQLLARGFEEMRRAIREEEPLPPSMRISTLQAGEQTAAARFRQAEPPRLIHLVRGDVDWIVMKCLEKDRTRRYATANALAMDLQRHLRHEPVTACPPSRWYEFQKAVRRHRFGFATTAAIMFALALGLVLTSREARRAHRAELQTRRIGYLADMDLAHRALNDADLGTAQSLLRRYWPAPGEVDLRQWEWRYLANLSQGDPHLSLVAHHGEVGCVRFLDDRTLMSACSADWRTILWNVEERQPATIITNTFFGGSVGPVVAPAPRRNRIFYLGAWRGRTKISHLDLEKGLDIQSEPEKGSFLEFHEIIESLDISPSQKVLAVAHGSQVTLVDLDRGTRVESFASKSGGVVQCLFSPDGRWLAVADEVAGVTLWNLAEHRPQVTLTRPSRPDDFEMLRFSSDGRWLVSPGGPSPTRVWDVINQQVVDLPDHTIASQAAFSPDGRWLATAGGDGSIRLWDTSRWQMVRSLRGHSDPVTCLDFSPDGRLLASGTRNGEVKLWSMRELATSSLAVTSAAAEYIGVAGDGSGFVRVFRLGLTNGEARGRDSGANHGATQWAAEIWSSIPLRRTLTFPLPAGRPSVGAVLGGGQGLALGGYDGSIRIFAHTDGQSRVVSNAHIGVVYLLDASRDGSTLATKAMENSKVPEDRVCIWRLPGMELIAELPHARDVHGIKLSDDGRLLAAFTGQGDVGVWSIPSMKGPPMWHGIAAHQTVRVCAFSPDNRWLAAAPPDGSAFLWDLATRRRTVLPRSQIHYTSLSFSPDGSRLAAGSEAEGRLFDPANGQVILSFPARGRMVAFLSDGERLLSVHRGGASLLQAPPLETLRFPWLSQRPSEEPVPYLGPDPDYSRPDRPQRRPR